MNNPQTPAHRYDFVIVGGGPVGILLFHLLRELPYKVALIEKQKQLHDPDDPRSYILNCGLIERLIEHGVLSRSTADNLIRLNSLVVSCQRAFFKFRLVQHDPDKCLKYVIRATQLREELATNIEKDELWLGSNIQTLTNNPNEVEIQLKQDERLRSLRTRILIACDGATSPTARLLNVAPCSKGRKHYALVLPIESDRATPKQAEQCISTHGLISMVPNSSHKLTSIVVNSDKARLEAINLEDAAVSFLHDIWRKRYGRLKALSKGFIMPIQPLTRPVGHDRVLFMGDAQCTLSPVAAMGLSLGMDSALNLLKLLAQKRPDLSQAQSWRRFSEEWNAFYQNRYRKKQRLNQWYARTTMNLNKAPVMLSPILALAGSNPVLCRYLSRLLSQ